LKNKNKLKDRYTKWTLFKVYDYNYKNNKRLIVLSEIFPLIYKYLVNIITQDGKAQPLYV
jgi:hypothetical protein